MPITREQIINSQYEPDEIPDENNRFIEHIIGLVKIWEESGNKFDLCDEDHPNIDIQSTPYVCINFTKYDIVVNIGIIKDHYHVTISSYICREECFDWSKGEIKYPECRGNIRDFNFTNNFDYSKVINAVTNIEKHIDKYRPE